MKVELAFGLFGILSVLWVLSPQMLRIWRRKSSSDFSKVSAIGACLTQVVWLGYAFHNGGTGLIVSGIAWMIMLVLNAILIWMFYEKGRVISESW